MPDVSSGVIDFFLHPPLGVLTQRLDYFGPYSGNVTRTQYSSTPGPIFTPIGVNLTFGVIVQLNGAIPAGWGYTSGWEDPLGLLDENMYDERLCQLVVQHQLIGGAWITTQLLEVRSFPRLIMWEVAFPGRIGLLVAPGLAFDLFYLTVP